MTPLEIILVAILAIHTGPIVKAHKKPKAVKKKPAVTCTLGQSTTVSKSCLDELIKSGQVKYQGKVQ